MSEDNNMDLYFKSIKSKVKQAYVVAEKARSKNLDPEPKVEIMLAETMVDRVLGLISVVAPQLLETGVPEKIKEYEEQYGILDWRVGFKIAEAVAKQEFCTFKDKKEAIEVGIRTGFAYLTLGIVAAPLEGFIGIDIKKRKDGKEYLAVRYAGPIRGAGGTASSTSVILADYVRTKMGYHSWDPSEKEINRYVTEVNDYHERVTNLQYRPSDDELSFMLKNLPIEVAGDSTERIEVSNYKDLPRVETNLIRGGVALVLAEGLCQKAPKLWKRLNKWGNDFDLEWNFMGDFLKLKEKIHSANSKKNDDGDTVKANDTFIADIVAGRPVLTHPLAVGGFRLRYGRTRLSGFSAAAVHPATLEVLENFIAIGTQLKVERPGKAATITCCETIDGPIVLLKNGSVVSLQTREAALKIKKEVDRILYLGDILFNYGDFSENGSMLVPCGYTCEEWEAQTNKVSPGSFKEALLHTLNGLPMHPKYSFFWRLISSEELKYFKNNFSKGKFNAKVKNIAEKLGIPHTKDYEVDTETNAVLQYTFSLIQKWCDGTALDVLELNKPGIFKDLAGTFIGARMGRPEKAKMRSLAGTPHGLFPIAGYGGKLKFLNKALEHKMLRLPLSEEWALENKYATPQKYGVDIDIEQYFSDCKKMLGTRDWNEKIKGVEKLRSRNKIPEHLLKSFLRSKHKIFVNKDGTTRYDCTELPITHFKPVEIGTSIEKLRELGYTKDVDGKELENENQLLEIYPQDIIVPNNTELEEGACDVLTRISKFCDDELNYLYDTEPFYNAINFKGLVGELIIGLAPHISAGTVGRIIGFSKTQGFLAHPMFHAALRRDCDGDEACIMLLMDGLLNFSKSFLPSSRGSTMDACLVLTSVVYPSEVDDQVLGMDVEWSYPHIFYQSANSLKKPWEVKITQLNHRLNTPLQYKDFGYTHKVENLNNAVVCSAYKTLPSMKEKLQGQMEIARKIDAVNMGHVAQLVIQRHLLADMKGNLRKFSMQGFRCTSCNTKYRRPPLTGLCTECTRSNIIFTISHGSVIKYLGTSLGLVDEYEFSSYLKETIHTLERNMEAVFGREKEKQTGLTQFY